MFSISEVSKMLHSTFLPQILLAFVSLLFQQVGQCKILFLLEANKSVLHVVAMQSQFHFSHFQLLKLNSDPKLLNATFQKQFSSAV